MSVYFLQRLLLAIPTMIGITLVCFVLVNLMPGGPIEQRLQEMRFGGAGLGESGVSNEVMEAMRYHYGLDQPLPVRYWRWVTNILKLDFGRSFLYERSVIDVIVSRFPVSLTFGIVSLILTYLVCIPLGVAKAVWHQSRFDRVTSFLLFVAYSVPPLMLGILLIVFLAGASYLDLFPTGGLYSEEYHYLGFWEGVIDRLHHAVLPLLCYMIGGFTVLTLLMRNSMLDVIKLDYIRTARAKGLQSKVVYMKHALRNALMPVVTGMTGIFTLFLTGSVIVENIFSLDGIGLLSLNALRARDYNVLMGLIVLSSFFILIGRIFVDFLYVILDPRIDFS